MNEYLMNESLKIKFIDVGIDSSFEDLNEVISQVPIEPISHQPWSAYADDTKASFSIAHNGEAIFLKYKISEKHLLANEVNNGKIHHDSCVEFFIAFDDHGYYNLEFNCLGFKKIAFGSQRKNRELIPLEISELVGFNSIINNASKLTVGGGFDWEILLVIPKEIFTKHQLQTFTNLRARGNFYKCGDSLPQPHFLTWNMVDAEKPDFHRVESFGILDFGDPYSLSL